MEQAVQNAVQNVVNGSPAPLFLFKTAKIAAVLTVLAIALLWKCPANVKFYAYGAARELLKTHAVIAARGMDRMASEHFFIKFKPEEREMAGLVLETAERFYRPVTEDFGFVPRRRIPIILYSSKEELNKSFGWEAKESAMGVYWAGAIRVLSPAAWIGETEPGRVREAFASAGPMAHELAHLMVDYLTGGNYPRWFTEGLAQYEEHKLTGFEFDDPAGSLRQPLYSMNELTYNFDSLPNQSLAYRESLAAVRYIAYRYGEGALAGLLRELGAGKDFGRAVREVLHLDEGRFEAEWQEWARRNNA